MVILKKYFINLSNHPSDKWDSAQTQGALSFGEIKDIPFPAVPPEYDEDQIDELADEYVAKVTSIDGDVAAVLVQGEYSLTYAVVRKLLAIGKKVMLACSARNIVERVDENGETVKEVRFKFVRFREYR